MRKGILLLVVAGLLSFIGCAEKPEDAARRIVDQQVAIHHKGIELDTAQVVYTVVAQDALNATVEATGNITIKAVIPLAKQGRKWVLDVPADETPGKKAATAH